MTGLLFLLTPSYPPFVCSVAQSKEKYAELRRSGEDFAARSTTFPPARAAQ
jgi:hypothetical protein